jgi:acid phosphatase family membrane protein YuiD
MITQFILIITVTWLFGKLLKTIIAWNKEKKINWKVVIYDGGMPSAHTILVASTSTALYLETGISYIFFLSLILTLIVMNDAMKVRWVTEEQSRALNKLTEGKKGFAKLDEHVGHTPTEVLVGLIIGILVPMILYQLI